MTDYDPAPIYGFIPSFWRDHYGDRAQFGRLWEAVSRLMDDEWAQLEQVNDSSYVSTVPTHIFHTYLSQELEAWQSYGVPHKHFRKDFRATAAQQTFYLEFWPDLESFQLFVNGKEVDPIADPFIVTLEQDALQKAGSKPAGARLVFDSPLALNTPVSIFSDKDLLVIETEISGGLISVSLPADVDIYSSKVVLKKLNITASLDITADDFSWTNASTSATDDRVFRKGERFEIIDGTAIQNITLSSTATTVDIPTPVTPGTAKIYKLIDFEVTNGVVSVDGTVLRASGQPFPVSARVRVSDVGVTRSILVEEAVDSLEMGAEFTNAMAYMYGGRIIDGYEVTETSLTFDRSYVDGMVVYIEAAYEEDNDHGEHRVVTTTLTDQASVPVTRPFALTAGLAERPNFPIQVFMDGVMLYPDTYTFLSTTTIELVSPLIFPIGTVVDFYYVDTEAPEPHLHVRESFRVANPISAFALSGYVSEDFSRYVSVDGVTVSDPDLRKFTPNGRFLNFFYPVPGGSLVRIRGSHKSFLFYHALDAQIIQADYFQNGIDQQSSVIPAGWTIQLAWDSGFLITPGLLESNAQIEDAWLVNVLIDEETAYRNFGHLIDFRRATSNDYVQILRALFPSNYRGSQITPIESMINIILGSEYLQDPATITSITGKTIQANGQTLQVDQNMPARVSAGEEYERFYAVSSFAEVTDDLPATDFMAVMMEQFSPDYRYARTLDRNNLVVREGGAVTYDRDNLLVEDPNEDFFEWEVWRGDLIGVESDWDPGVFKYGRILEVHQHSVKVDLTLGVQLIGFGEGYFGQYTFGGGQLLEQINSYKIWARETNRVDTWRHLDEALNEEIPYLAERAANLLEFVALVRLRWKALRNAQALNDVAVLLDRMRPGDSSYLIYSEVNDETGLEDEIQGDLTDVDPEREVVPATGFVTEEFGGFVGITGEIDPNVGSFVGIVIL